MGLIVGNHEIKSVNNGISFSGGWNFDSVGRGGMSTQPGASLSGNSGQPASWTTPVNIGMVFGFATNFNGSTTFTAPVAGVYAFGWSGLARGYQTANGTAVYMSFAKNGAMIHNSHMNMTIGNEWGMTGSIGSVTLAAGDSLTLSISPSASAVANFGWYGQQHSATWILLIG